MDNERISTSNPTGGRVGPGLVDLDDSEDEVEIDHVG